MKNTLRKIIIYLTTFMSSLVFFVLCFTYFYPVDNQLKNFTEPTLPQDLDQYLAQSEARYPFKKDTQKMIVWAHPQHEQTEYSLVFLHGFSATRHELSPLVETLANKLDANIFFTRLTGHGLANEEMGKAIALDWIHDTNEAFAIGKKIGKKIIFIGSSTGASLAVHIAQNNPPELKAMIFFSANFRPASVAAWLASGALGPYLIPVVMGPTIKWQPLNDRQAYFWTHEYPSSAAHQLMELIKYIDQIDLKQVHVPTISFYTPNDKVVSIDLIQSKFKEMSNEKNRLVKIDSPYHVMAGDIVGPQGTEPALNAIDDFLNSLN